MSELWGKWKHRLIFGVCAWILLAFVFLSASVDHPFFSAETGTKFYNTVSDIILLKWVTKYQTLLAGLAAIIGGFFVLLAAQTQIKSDLNQKNQAKLEEVSNNLNLVANYFWLASKEFRFKRDDGLEILSKAENLAYYTTQCNPNLSDIMLTSIQIVKDRCSNSTGHVTRTCTLLFGVSCIFAEASKLLNKRNDGLLLSKDELKFPSKKIEDYINGIGGEQKHLMYLTEYFDFDASTTIK